MLLMRKSTRITSDPPLISRRSNLTQTRTFSWGSSLKGQLGIGIENGGVSIPTEITALEGMTIRCLAAGGDKSAAINSYGELFTFGSSKN